MLWLPDECLESEELIFFCYTNGTTFGRKNIWTKLFYKIYSSVHIVPWWIGNYKNWEKYIFTVFPDFFYTPAQQLYVKHWLNCLCFVKFCVLFHWTLNTKYTLVFQKLQTHKSILIDRKAYPTHTIFDFKCPSYNNNLESVCCKY